MGDQRQDRPEAEGRSGLTTGARERIGAWLSGPSSSDTSTVTSTDTTGRIDPLRAMLDGILESSVDGIVALRAVRDDGGTIVDFEIAALSASAERLLGKSAADVVGTTVSQSWPGLPDERFARYAEVVESGTTWTSRIQMPHSDELWFDIWATGLAGQGLVTIFRDVTAQMFMDELVDAYQQRQQVLERQALHDPLTGLANRLLVESRLEHALSRLDRISASVAVFFIDLDGLKSINDTYGHAAGDGVLVEIGARLRSVARSYDTVGRIGGDEFVIVCEDLDSIWDIDRLARRFVTACAAPMVVDGEQVVVPASVGVAIGESSATAVADLLDDADTAMYRAKSEGGGRVGYFDAAVHEAVVVRRDVELGLQRAITDDELHVDFDPVADATGEVVAFRTHLGWHHPRHGLVDNETLAGAADTTGIARALTDWVLDRTFAHLAPWLAAATGPTRFVIVDIDGAVLIDSGFTDRAVDHMQRYGIDPRAVCFALDGGFMTGHVDQVKAVIEPLAALGVRIARDGVAASGSALTYLRSLPIEIIILDPALTNDPGHADDSLLRLVIDTAKGGHRVVMAASVATAEQADALVAVGVDLVQTDAATTRAGAFGDGDRHLA